MDQKKKKFVWIRAMSRDRLVGHRLLRSDASEPNGDGFFLDDVMID